jgi:2-succinyl-5-enolpyruvyl-6-hydroxy-3-cyclohexene-1-carboxylate synthase
LQKWHNFSQEPHVEWNGTENIIDELIQEGIPESVFVPAFRNPELRLAAPQEMAIITP